MGRPPATDEIELSLFGPGFGEAVAVHLGRGRWFVIDSCLNPITKEPAVLEYFDQLGIDPNEAIECIVATHWHSDHMAGLDRVLARCPAARFAMSGALRNKEFMTMIFADQTYSRGGKVMDAVLTMLDERGKVPECVPANTMLYVDRESDVDVVTLSPSHQSIHEARQTFAALIPRAGAPRKEIEDLTPNDVSLVLQIRMGNVSVLLGADLEHSADIRKGWVAILDNPCTPSQRSSAFKVPHHGSKDAHYHRVWTTLLAAEPISLITPFIRGRTKLPNQIDCERIRQLSSVAYLTAPAEPRAARNRDKTTQRSIREAGVKLQRSTNDLGHVRLRRPSSAQNWTVDRFGPAIQL